MSTCAFFCLATSRSAAQDKPGGKVPTKEKLLAQAIPGYKHRVIEGFDLLLNSEVLEHNDDKEYKRKPLDVLELELGTINRSLPPRPVNALRTVVIWVEWHDKEDPDLARGVLAKYYGVWGNAPLWALTKGKHPWKANNIEIINMKSLTAEHQPGVKFERCVILHELSHAVHLQLFGPENPHIKAAYQQAMNRGLYDEATDVYGRKIKKPYASVNEKEYFAELSCAYLNKLHYFPNMRDDLKKHDPAVYTRDDLKKHDPAGYKMMELTWGTPKQIDAALKAEGERVATRRIAAAKKLQVEGKTEEARATLQKLVEHYPSAMATAEAKRLLEKWK